MVVQNAVVSSLDQGIFALLASKSSKVFQRLVPAHNLILFLASLQAILRAIPSSWPVAGRVCGIMGSVLSAILFNTVLGAVSVAPDTGLVCLNLLSVFFLGQCLDQQGRIATTTQFLLVSALTNALRGNGLVIAWAMAFLPNLPEDISQIAQLVSLETISAWLHGWIAPSLLLPSTVLILYLCAPFTRDFPVLGRFYSFAVFAFSEDVNFSLVPAWLIAAGLWALWRAEPDDVSKRFASVAGINVAVVAVLDATRADTDSDPGPILLGVLVAIRIMEDMGEACQKTRPNTRASL
jgi:hypothetical protein